MMLVHSALSAGTYVFGKRALADLGAAELAIARFVLAAAIHAVVLVRLRVRVARGDLLPLAALGVVAVAVNQYLFLEGLSRSSPGHAALLYALTPVFVFLIGWARRSERATTLKLAGIVVAFAGTLVVLGGRGALAAEGRDALVGDVMLLGAVVAWSVYAVGGKAYAARYGGLEVGSFTLVVGTLLYAPVGLWFLHPAHFAALSAGAWFGLGYLVLVTSTAAWLIYYWALARAEASRVAVWSNLQPVLTAMLAWAMYGDRLTAPFVAGGAMVLAGVVMTERG
jgi:drug/metabolite transporter (DMT)-like permease